MQPSSRPSQHRLRCYFISVMLLVLFLSPALAEQQPHALKLSRPVRSWEFLPVVGERAGLFGNEAGQLEAWVYPLKILRNFHLTFLVGGRAFPADTLARTITVRPESGTILYSSDTFSVSETLFVPAHEAGAVVLIDVETSEPLEMEAAYYRDYLNTTVNLDLPDPALQQAYDWSRISMLQGLVSNPFLGTGLIAGYRTSGDSQRPGFAWFFGRDSLWTSLALNSAGDFKTTRTALDFLSKYQRADGKIPHEMSQGASFVPWVTDYPYGFASVGATPLYIIGLNDYVVRSGDVDFAKTKWESVWKAYQFLRS